jgi:hypothetical protein
MSLPVHREGASQGLQSWQDGASFASQSYQTWVDGALAHCREREWVPAQSELVSALRKK